LPVYVTYPDSLISGASSITFAGVAVTVTFNFADFPLEAFTVTVDEPTPTAVIVALSPFPVTLITFPLLLSVHVNKSVVTAFESFFLTVKGYAFTAPRSGGVMERLNSKWRRRCYEKSNY
jgi:hypothetical protein